MIWSLAFVLLAAGEPQPSPAPAAALTSRPRKDDAERLRVAERALVTPGETLDASDAVDELVDEFAADMARAGASTRFGPVLLERVQLSPNLNPAFARVLESRLAAALARAGSIPLVRCLECFATRARVEEGAWTVRRGVTSREELRALGKSYEARTLLSVNLAVRPQGGTVDMDVELARVDDASIAFSEEYRIDAGRALLYRGADRSQAREERLREVADLLQRRPRISWTIKAGPMFVPSAAPEGGKWGGFATMELAEHFGGQGEYAAGLEAGAFVTGDKVVAAMVGGVLGTDLGQTSIYSGSFSLAGSAGLFTTGAAGNTAYFGAQLRFLAGSRVALFIGADYVLPFQLKTKNASFGGFSPLLGVGFTWR